MTVTELFGPCKVTVGVAPVHGFTVIVTCTLPSTAVMTPDDCTVAPPLPEAVQGRSRILELFVSVTVQV